MGAIASAPGPPAETLGGRWPRGPPVRRTGRVRLWIDECLLPTLVAVAQGRYEATCNEYRGMLHATDRALFAVLSSERWVLVTNNDPRTRTMASCRVSISSRAGPPARNTWREGVPARPPRRKAVNPQ
jgi:hypothetical protein